MSEQQVQEWVSVVTAAWKMNARDEKNVYWGKYQCKHDVVMRDE